jgi:hypothetical protein
VVIALITTVFGSLAVALAANSVTRALGERELQFKVVDALIEYTKQKDMDNVPAISKLDALTRLIKDNEQFSVRVDGFLAMLDKLRNDDLTLERKRSAETEKEIKRIQAQLTLSELSESTRIALKGDLADKEQAMSALRAREQEIVSQLAKQDQFGKTVLADLTAARAKIAELEQRLAKPLPEDCRDQSHRVKLKVESDNSADTLLSLSFTDSEDATPWVQKTGFHEFSVPGRPSRTIERTVCSDMFLKRRYLALTNESSNGWTGKITLSFDDAMKFAIVIPNGQKIQQESRQVPLDELLKRREAVLSKH